VAQKSRRIGEKQPEAAKRRWFVLEKGKNRSFVREMRQKSLFFPVIQLIFGELCLRLEEPVLKSAAGAG